MDFVSPCMTSKSNRSKKILQTTGGQFQPLMGLIHVLIYAEYLIILRNELSLRFTFVLNVKSFFCCCHSVTNSWIKTFISPFANQIYHQPWFQTSLSRLSPQIPVNSVWFPVWSVCPASWSGSAQTPPWGPPWGTAWSPGAPDHLRAALRGSTSRSELTVFIFQKNWSKLPHGGRNEDHFLPGNNQVSRRRKDAALLCHMFVFMSEWC